MLVLVQSMKILILRIELEANYRTHDPHAVRDLAVRENSSLYDLAAAIVEAYGFDFDHPFGFFSVSGNDFLRSQRKYELFADMKDIAAEHPDSLSVERTVMTDVWKIPGDRMTFLFDYGDMWRFTVTLVGLGSAEPGKRYPKIVGQEGEGPLQYPPS